MQRRIEIIVPMDDDIIHHSFTCTRIRSKTRARFKQNPLRRIVIHPTDAARKPMRRSHTLDSSHHDAIPLISIFFAMCDESFDETGNRSFRAGRDKSKKPPRMRGKTKSKQGARRNLPASASPRARSRSPRLIDAVGNCRIKRYNSFTNMKSFDPGGGQSDQGESRGWHSSSDTDADALLFLSKDDDGGEGDGCEGDGCEGDDCEGDGCEDTGERRVSEDVNRDATESPAEDGGDATFARPGYSYLDPLRDAMRSKRCGSFEALASMTPPRR